MRELSSVESRVRDPERFGVDPEILVRVRFSIIDGGCGRSSRCCIVSALKLLSFLCGSSSSATLLS